MKNQYIHIKDGDENDLRFPECPMSVKEAFRDSRRASMIDLAVSASSLLSVKHCTVY